MNDGKSFYIAEKLNNIKLNVYGFDNSNNAIYCIYNSAQHSEEKFKDVDILIISDENDPTHHHYTYIKKLNTLLFDQNKHKNATYYCRKCLQGFQIERVLKEHRAACSKVGITTYIMPKPGSVLKFH